MLQLRSSPFKERNGAAGSRLDRFKCGDVGERHEGVSEPESPEHSTHASDTDNHDPPPEIEPSASLGEESSRMPPAPKQVTGVGYSELHGSHESIAYELNEKPVVVVADTILCPYTMVIHLVDAAAAATAVRHPRKLVVYTLQAFLFIQIVDRIHVLSFWECLLLQ